MSTLLVENIKHEDAVGNALTFDAAGNIGIGTASPGEKLDIAEGDIWIRHNNTASTFAGIQFGLQPGHGSYRAAILGGPENHGVTDSGAITFHTQNGYVVSDIPPERVRIASNGNVGIGTTSPSSKLEVANGGIHVTSPTGIQGLVIDTDQANSEVSGRFVLKNNTSAASVYYSDSLGWTFHTGTILGVTSGTQRMYLTPEGYIRAPYQPAFSAQNTAMRTVTGNSQNIIFDRVDINAGGGYNGTTGQFTAPVTGNYWIVFEALIDAGEDDTVDLRFYINGSRQEISSDYVQSDVSTGYRKARMQTVVALNKNDYIDVRPQASGTYTFYGDTTQGAGHTGFKGFLIG